MLSCWGVTRILFGTGIRGALAGVDGVSSIMRTSLAVIKTCITHRRDGNEDGWLFARSVPPMRNYER